MKYILVLVTTVFFLPVPASGQGYEVPSRKQQIERVMESVYSLQEFRRIADLLELSARELFDYPVISPVKKPVISSGFGTRNHPIYKKRKFHSGLDLPKPKGTPVYATGNGIVIRKGYNPGYGNFIEVKHSGGFRSFYAHLSKTIVDAGDSVGIASLIAYVGSTGASTGNHLHYEVRKGSRFLNPVGWCRCLFEIWKSRL